MLVIEGACSLHAVRAMLVFIGGVSIFFLGCCYAMQFMTACCWQGRACIAHYS